MNRHVNAISGRLSLRPPQRESLEILHRVMEIAPSGRNQVLQAALDVVGGEYPTVTDFERSFPSLCFALATGVGKTRLMGAFISYLHLAHGICNFLVLAHKRTATHQSIGEYRQRTAVGELPGQRPGRFRRHLLRRPCRPALRLGRASCRARQ